MTDTTSTLAVATQWLRRFAAHVAENKDLLTELDSAIGDADHGANMARGMAAVATQLDTKEFTSATDLLRQAGMTLVSTVGGASGPLYGTFFMKAAAPLSDPALQATALTKALLSGLDGVLARGRAELGDKTMVDAMSPAVEAFSRVAGSGGSPTEAADAAREAAAAGRDATIPLVARKGRASYLGERSAGHTDPGAASTALLFAALAEALEG
ncbi:MAG TPA: dihydroxyacetone kinase subunit DhaL [Arachnia sp.]|nr:dihydroxyacetone kinase subunit DhaL [Arachnia sp.]HMT86923.1 dihydroxyacetone kinase subunit DhaL [Arachnia sp.]